MGNTMCVQSERDSLHKKRNTKKSPPQPQLVTTQQVYFTNPAEKDEDFTFNDKLKMQSVLNKLESGHFPCFPDNQVDDSYLQDIASSLIEEISRINCDEKWASNNKTDSNSMELLYCQDTEKILFCTKIISKNHPASITRQVASSKVNSRYYENAQELYNSNAIESKSSLGSNSMQNQTNSSLQMGTPQLLSHPDIHKQQTSIKNIKLINSFQSTSSIQPNRLNIVKVEFEVGCSAEKLLKGIQQLHKYSQKIMQHKIIQKSSNNEFSLQHILFTKHAQTTQRDFLLMSYSAEIGENLNNCYASVQHQSVPESQDIQRIQVFKAGHTFFERYDAPKSDDQLNLQRSLDKQNTTMAFDSMNLNIGKARTKVRFYGEFICKNQQDEQLLKMVFLTEFRDYISMCKNIAKKDGLSSFASELENEEEKNIESFVDNEQIEGERRDTQKLKRIDFSNIS